MTDDFYQRILSSIKAIYFSVESEDVKRRKIGKLWRKIEGVCGYMPLIYVDSEFGMYRSWWDRYFEDETELDDEWDANFNWERFGFNVEGVIGESETDEVENDPNVALERMKKSIYDYFDTMSRIEINEDDGAADDDGWDDGDYWGDDEDGIDFDDIVTWIIFGIPTTDSTDDKPKPLTDTDNETDQSD